MLLESSQLKLPGRSCLPTLVLLGDQALILHAVEASSSLGRLGFDMLESKPKVRVLRAAGLTLSLGFHGEFLVPKTHNLSYFIVRKRIP